MPTLVVSGASQGAQSINDFVLALARSRPEIFAGWQILHQAGPDRAQAVEAAYRDIPVPSRTLGLIDDVGLLWGSATLVLARSGAGTVAEIWSNNLPALLMPYPHHKDQHQRLNAKPIVDAGLATILTDHVDPAANIEAHAATLAAALAAAPTPPPPVPVPDGAAKIARFLRNL
jgi:UDP-N-acetylglucosamine:LPS N-acetylglucosamine transferase